MGSRTNRGLIASRINSLPDGRHFDGNGLSLHVRGGSRLWFYRYQRNKKRQEISLGSYPSTSLAEARLARNEVQTRIARGDEIRKREIPTVEQMTAQTFEAIKGDLKRDGEAGRWLSPVRMHILPRLGHIKVADLTALMIRDALEPIWRSKTSAASKAADRLGIVVRHAAAAYPGQIDATIVANAKLLLGSQGHTVKHIPAMPWVDVPVFMASLGSSPVDLALKLLILTASRSAPIRFARAEQFDGSTWVVPAENMKSSLEFRVPLSAAAIEVVEAALPLSRDGFLFCGHRGKPISDMAMTALLRRRQIPFRPHGFRSSFRDWCAETEQDWTLAEISLDHAVGGKVQRSYQRSDLLEQRRPLIQAWSAFCCGSE